MSQDLIRFQIVALVDGPGLSLLCDTLVQYLEARTAVEKVGLKVSRITSQGQKIWIRNPDLQVRDDARAALLRIYCQFGMTPASRSGLKTGSGEPEKKKEKTKGRFFKAG